VPDERYGEEVLAAVVLHTGAALEPGELLAFCRARLSRVKLPRLLSTLSELPVGPSGKVLRREVRHSALTGTLTIDKLEPERGS
jgi:long-chain acyl-CoA synthetase